ncbi:hypothetical protein E6C76_16295 [Pseudothauera nasutitermitis]|uniref:YqjK-like protein n=1 Tax=Pseudothauera nasutitermitis TaxID=2565930 RepID=A0A4S4ASU9_9RHOO|nr:YqjK family protein [Pseudothauera nasutitermitis]THF62830.1 hypothetical protein E6C76_16295 [Pseudothauera nasutitermitis]
MNPRLVEFALRKQRLQIKAEYQRADMVHRLAGIESALDTVDTIREQFTWARQHAPLLSSGVLLLLFSRPRMVLRLARSGWVGWLLWSRLRGRGPRSLLTPVVAPALRLLLGLFRRRA